MKIGITMLIHNKDDIEFVTEFPCFLGHPVYNTTIKLNLPGCNKVRQFGKLRNLRDHNLKNLPSFGK